MAMTKKEKEAFQAAIDRAEMLAALRWTQPVPFDVLPPSPGAMGSQHTEGWRFNAYSGRVELGWSESCFHGSGPYPSFKTHRSASHGASRMYSTKALALMAMRHEVEIESAKKLMQIDRQIEAAKGGEA